MTYEFTTRKSHVNGITVETFIELNECNHDQYGTGKRVLTFATSKTGTTASVTEDYDGVKCSALFQDYFKTVTRERIGRATQKAIETAHQNAMQFFAEHIEAAKAQYNVSSN